MTQPVNARSRPRLSGRGLGWPPRSPASGSRDGLRAPHGRTRHEAGPGLVLSTQRRMRSQMDDACAAASSGRRSGDRHARRATCATGPRRGDDVSVALHPTGFVHPYGRPVGTGELASPRKLTAARHELDASNALTGRHVDDATIHAVAGCTSKSSGGPSPPSLHTTTSTGLERRRTLARRSDPRWHLSAHAWSCHVSFAASSGLHP